MFNSSGSMYEEIEQNRLKKQRKKKIMTRRIIVIVVLVIFLTYLGILLNDIRRFHKGDLPLIVLKTDIDDNYDDGRVETYTSLGWVFRFYYRETINTTEIAPIWSKIQMKDVLNRTIDVNLPEVEKEYEIPSNINYREKIGSVLYFYNDEQKLLGTYKCLLSESDCEIAQSAYLQEYDKMQRNNNVRMDIINERYVFIAEYKSKGTSVEEKHVYLYDIKAKRLIAEYEDVRYVELLTKDRENYKETLGGIDKTKYVCKKNGKWGIDDVDKGKVTNFIGYEYKLINFDLETRLYIFYTTENKWVIFDPNTKHKTAPIDKTIESVHYKNGKAYVVAYEIVNFDQKNYYLYDEDGNNLLYKENIDNLKAYDDFLVYGKDDYIYIVNYDGKEAADSIKLYINLNESYNNSVKPYSVEIVGKTLKISTPHDQERTHFVDTYIYDIDTLDLVKTIRNAKETSY